MENLTRKLGISSVVTIVMLLCGFSAHAEDIEIYNRLQTEPNVVFILDQSESMLQLVGSTGKTRDEIVKEAFQTVMSQPYNNLNVGFMDYGRDNGAGVDLPVSDVNDLARNVEPGVASTTETYASLLTRFVNNLEGPQPNAKTALVEALLEAAKYYRGDVIDNLSQGIGNQGTWNDGLSQYTGGAWRAAGPRTLTTAGSSPVQGSYCHAASSPSGAPYSQCSNPFPGTCQNISATSSSSGPAVTHQHGTQCKNPPGYGCTQYDITGTECVQSGCLGGTEPSPTHTHPAYNNPGTPAYTRCRETSSSTAKTYISPIQTACTENFIVLLSDGAPTILGSHEQTSIQGFAGTSSCQDLSTLGFSDPSILSKGVCGPDLTKAISTRDISTSIPGTQTVNTYTVGFDLGAGANEAKTYLELLASEGNGQFFDASGSAGVNGLVTIFQNIFNSITQKPRVISRAGTSVDLSTLNSSRPEVYVPMFSDRPNEPRWPGNLKGYSVDLFGDLKGLAGNDAFLDIDTTVPPDGVPDESVFNPSAKSFWSSTADGSSVTTGGIAPLINPIGRDIKTVDSGGNLIGLDSGVTSLNSNPALFGLPGSTPSTVIDNLIDWVNGIDVYDEDGDTNATEARKFVGDPLHSDPVIASYDTNSDGSVDKVVTYFMTNEGLLHAIDATSNTTASEIFAFMPRELLDNLDPLQKNVSGSPKVYGLDGPLVLFQVGGPTNLTGQKYLFFGMRRGGMNYYALNVTDPSNPVLMWTINGGTGDFKELGQTWSKPIVTNVNVSGTSTLALVLGGGYDRDQDTTSAYAVDDQGRAVYIVNAVSGSKIWSAGPSSSLDSHDLILAMDNAVPGDVSLVDLNNDTFVERLYFGDVGGHVWRVDIEGDITDTSKVSGYLLADLHGTSTVDNRRFFGRPVAATMSNGKLAVTIGSGNRAHPLASGTTDRFYTLFDPNPTSVPSSTPSVIYDSNLQDLTGFSSGYDYSLSTSGWRVDLSAGEKVFNEASVLRGELFFNTYIPPTSVCSNIPDGASFFILNLDGEPTRDLDTTPDGIKDASTSIYSFGIVPPMVLHYGNTGRVTGLFLPNDQEIYSSGSLEDKFWTNNP